MTELRVYYRLCVWLSILESAFPNSHPYSLELWSSVRSVSKSSSSSKASAFKREKSSVSDVSGSDSYRLNLWTAGRAALQRLRC